MLGEIHHKYTQYFSIISMTRAVVVVIVW